MFRRALIFLFQCVVLLRSSVGASPTVRIMPLGDAFTAGTESFPNGYRWTLYDELVQKGYDIEFVGRTLGDSTLPHTFHEGYRGWKIYNVIQHIQELLDKTEPDIILLLIGTVDVSSGDNAGKISSRYESLIKEITKLRPYVRIIASNLPPRENHVSANNSVNDDLKSIVRQLKKSGKKVTFLDMNSVIKYAHLIDNVHLNWNGYEKMGKAWAASVKHVIDNRLRWQKPGILRVSGGLDRQHVMVTFTNPVSADKIRKEDFTIDERLEIYDVELDSEQRNLKIKTSTQRAGNKYSLSISQDGGKTIDFKFTVGWRFINLSDWHMAEKYVFRQREDHIANDVKIISHLSKNYGGDFVMIPGDTNAGFWDRSSFRRELNDHLKTNLSPEETVLMAGQRCYSGMLASFREGGYWKLLMAYGDHEAGDNPWDVNSLKSKLQPEFRKSFARSFNFDHDDKFMYKEPIGNAYSRPFSTDFEESSFAYIHKNVLIITVDIFDQESVSKQIGFAGTVTGRVTGKHRIWLEQVLKEGRDHPKVKHIFVQAHFPVMFPVRKVKSSGMYIDNFDESEFWQLMRRYNVDIYFSGEVHLNTVTKDVDSDLIQIASRGNYFTNFLTVDISDDTVEIICNNEKGNKPTSYNYKYERSGRLFYKKDSSGKKTIESSGELKLLNREAPLFHFNFERLPSLDTRPVLGLGDRVGVERIPNVRVSPVKGVNCRDSLPNVGKFDQNYDAQAANIELVSGVNGKSGRFESSSRAAVWSMGPHDAGMPISYALWFRTTYSSNQILISYEGFWLKPIVMNLVLRDGWPELIYSESQKVSMKYTNGRGFNDGNWHHVAISMPHVNCRLSAVKLFVDGKAKQTKVFGYNGAPMNLPSGGVLALGGFGYGGTRDGVDSYDRKGYREGSRFNGAMDDVLVWARSLAPEEMQRLATEPSQSLFRSKVSYQLGIAVCMAFDATLKGIYLKNCNDNNMQNWIVDSLGYIHRRGSHNDCLIPQDGIAEPNVAIKVMSCEKAAQYDFMWNIDPSGIIYYGGSDLVLSTDGNVGSPLHLQNKGEDLVTQRWEFPEGGPSDLTSSPSVQPSDFPSNSPSQFPSEKPSNRPSAFPSNQPSHPPTSMPSHTPSQLPSLTPSDNPSNYPSTQPSKLPSSNPSDQPSLQPSRKPSMTPSSNPSNHPTDQPSSNPSSRPSTKPSDKPSMVPSAAPTKIPSYQPSRQPSSIPSMRPSHQPSEFPSTVPSLEPSSWPSNKPSMVPSAKPSKTPSHHPSRQPSSIPSMRPSRQPSKLPSAVPSLEPSSWPSNKPSMVPSAKPSETPSHHPSRQPSSIPSMRPSRQPSTLPSAVPSLEPSSWPSNKPSMVPSTVPSKTPSYQPSRQPSSIPSMAPSRQPSELPSTTPSKTPSYQPSRQPSSMPSAKPSNNPTMLPSLKPSSEPSYQPSDHPSSMPSAKPSDKPSVNPSATPSKIPSNQPSDHPSSMPSTKPSDEPSVHPSVTPSKTPSNRPSDHPSFMPSVKPSDKPTFQPSDYPSIMPSSSPSDEPSVFPSVSPSDEPSYQPSDHPSSMPTLRPSNLPSVIPSSSPTTIPSYQPSDHPSYNPSVKPTQLPSMMPSLAPSHTPSISRLPSNLPSFVPSQGPTVSYEPSSIPSQYPSQSPSISQMPSSYPSVRPSTNPTESQAPTSTVENFVNSRAQRQHDVHVFTVLFSIVTFGAFLYEIIV